MEPLLNADLHCHSVVSDGTLTPEALAARAKANGVQLWALTDHDEIGGQERAIASAKALRRAARRALEIGLNTGTPVYVMKAGRIIDLTRKASGYSHHTGPLAIREVGTVYKTAKPRKKSKP